MSRVDEAGKALKSHLESLLPTATIIRTYTPGAKLEDSDLTGLQIFLTPEDTRTDLTTHNGRKFRDFVTYTIAIVKKISDLTDPTQEVDSLLDTVEEIRDSFIFEFHHTNTYPIKLVTTQAENSSARPLYQRGKLEDQNLFVSFLLVEVIVNGQKAVT